MQFSVPTERSSYSEIGLTRYSSDADESADEEEMEEVTADEDETEEESADEEEVEMESLDEEDVDDEEETGREPSHRPTNAHVPGWVAGISPWLHQARSS